MTLLGLVLVIPRDKSPRGTVRESPDSDSEPRDGGDGSGVPEGLPYGAANTEYAASLWQIAFTIDADAPVRITATGLKGPPEKSKPVGPLLHRQPKVPDSLYEQIRDAFLKHARDLRYATVEVSAGGVSIVRGSGPLHFQDHDEGFAIHLAPRAKATSLNRRRGVQPGPGSHHDHKSES